MSATNLSEITTLSELMEKVEEYRVTTSRLRIAHPGIDEIIWEIPDLPVDLVKLASEKLHEPLFNRMGYKRAIIFMAPGCHIHAVSVPVE